MNNESILKREVELLDAQIDGLRHLIKRLIPMHNANILMGALSILFIFVLLAAFACFILFGHDRFTSLMVVLIALALIGTGINLSIKTLHHWIRIE